MPEEAKGELLLRDVRLLSLDPAYDGRVRNVRVADGRIATVSDDAGSEEATAEMATQGATLVPLMDATVLDSRSADVEPPVPTPGSRADFVVVAGGVTRNAALHQLVVPPARLVLAVVDGQLVAKGGEPVVDNGTHADAVGADDPRWGTWVDRTGYLHQRLHADGRYDETRAGRPNAFTGACWLYRTRIVYLDDSGFWAFGQFVDDELHHAGFVMERS